MLNFKKAFTAVLISLIAIVSFLHTNSLYSCPVLKDSLRLEVGQSDDTYERINEATDNIERSSSAAKRVSTDIYEALEATYMATVEGHNRGEFHFLDMFFEDLSQLAKEELVGELQNDSEQRKLFMEILSKLNDIPLPFALHRKVALLYTSICAVDEETLDMARAYIKRNASEDIPPGSYLIEAFARDRLVAIGNQTNSRLIASFLGEAMRTSSEKLKEAGLKYVFVEFPHKDFQDIFEQSLSALQEKGRYNVNSYLEILHSQERFKPLLDHFLSYPENMSREYIETMLVIFKSGIKIICVASSTDRNISYDDLWFEDDARVAASIKEQMDQDPEAKAVLFYNAANLQRIRYYSGGFLVAQLEQSGLRTHTIGIISRRKSSVPRPVRHEQNSFFLRAVNTSGVRNGSFVLRRFADSPLYALGESLRVDTIYFIADDGVATPLDRDEFKHSDDMKAFVRARGGAVPFDTYMGEHIRGYYGSAVSIGEIGEDEQSDFGTYSLRPEFAHLIAFYLKASGLKSRVTFLELGGGDGSMLRNIDPFIDGKLLSQDISPKLIDMQEKSGAHAVLGDASEAINFAAGTVQVIFCNELLDAIACRILHFEASDGELEFNGEWHVDDTLTLKQQGPSPDVRPTAQSEKFSSSYSNYLRQAGVSSEASPEPASLDVAVGDYHRLLSEAYRVLDEDGVFIIIDYGYDNLLSLIGAETHETPRLIPYSKMRNRVLSVEDVLDRPYTVDLTYYVDFDFLTYVAEEIGFHVHDFQTMPEFFKSILSQQGLLENGKVPAKYEYLLNERLEHFKVLVLSKKHQA